MAVKLADTLAPMADFPAAMAKHIGFDDGKSLQEKYDLGELGGEGGGGHIELTQAEYDALSEEEKLNDVTYFITDAIGGGGDVSIDDNTISTETTWSSAKIFTEMSDNYAIFEGIIGDSYYSTTIDDEDIANVPVTDLYGDWTLDKVTTNLTEGSVISAFYNATEKKIVALTGDARIGEVYTDSFSVYDDTMNNGGKPYKVALLWSNKDGGINDEIIEKTSSWSSEKTVKEMLKSYDRYVRIKGISGGRNENSIGLTELDNAYRNPPYSLGYGWQITEVKTSGDLLPSEILTELYGEIDDYCSSLIDVGGTSALFKGSTVYFNTGYGDTPFEVIFAENLDKEITIPIIENGDIVTHHTITKNKSITDLPISTDRSGNKIYSTDELYLTYEFEELADAIEQWFTDKGITPERGMTYDDIEKIEFYVPAGAGYFYANSYFKFDNTAYFVYCLKYQDVEYHMFQMSYDHTNKKIYRNQRYGLNVINFGVLIPALAGSSVKTNILEVFHNWFKVYKPIGFDNAKGVPLTSNYDKQAASLSQDELVSVAYGNNQGAYDLDNGVSLMTSPLQRLLFTLNKEATELRAYANSESDATHGLSSGFFGSNLLQAKNTFKELEDMSSPPVPDIGTFGVYTVKPNATGQPEGLTKGGTLIAAHITASLYSQSVNYIGTRIAIFFTEGAMYYTLGLGGKYYPTSSWTSPIKWNKITTTLV